jgi:hypothetical protein
VTVEQVAVEVKVDPQMVEAKQVMEVVEAKVVVVATYLVRFEIHVLVNPPEALRI